MLGIKEIATYLPTRKVSNYDKKEQFELDDNFIENKIGIKYHTVKQEDEKASDLCIYAFKNLINKIDIDKKNIDCCVVITQNPDFKIPHTSAIVHGKLDLSQNCASFDISLGCSGYIYGLSNIISFMQYNGLKNGLLFTADPYSEIIDHNDKNTDLLFGDGATVTYICDDALYLPVDFKFGTDGSSYKEILCDKKLYMNGRAVFNFTATIMPKHIKVHMQQNNLEDDDIDKYILHQGSKYIVDTIRKRLKVSIDKVPYDIYEYGNTVSSSVPMMLEKEIYKCENKKMLLCAYGIGLSWASLIISRV